MQQMLWSTERLRTLTVMASDGEVGTISDLFFDDRSWTLRYLVVQTGGWLTGRKVLITPSAARRPDAGAGTITVALTREQVRTSPDVDADMPVSRQHEVDLHRHYGWTPYWGAPYVAGAPLPTPIAGPGPAGAEVRDDLAPSAAAEGDADLRSVREVTGYHIGARDGAIGHVDEFLIDEEDWRLRYMVVDTTNWLPGGQVVLATAWIRDVSWSERKVFVDLDRARIKDAPAYDPGSPFGPDDEARLYEHYGRNIEE